MGTLLVVMEDAVLVIAWRGGAWSARPVLSGARFRCIAADPSTRGRVYCGTADQGLLCSDDAGETWQPLVTGIRHPHVSAVAVAASPASESVVYAGTEPTTVFRSDDGGASWHELEGLLDLPSASTWSFPPRPDTHHVRWMAPDPHRTGRVFVAVEAGALVRTDDGGRTWHDRVPGSPIDTHTLVIHPLARDRLYSAAGDGYFESGDGGESWSRPQEGLRHRYVWGCAVHPVDPETVLVSAARSARAAHTSTAAEAHVYRRSGPSTWEESLGGLPEPAGTTVSLFAVAPEEREAVPHERGVFAVNNRGVFRSADFGASWEALSLEWPARFLRQRPAGIAILPGS